MHIVVVGAGYTGSALARWLLSSGHEVSVVERDRGRCEELDEVLGSVSVFGDGTDSAVLAKAGTNRADVVVATTRSDDVNLVACQLAKHHFAVPRTMSVVNVRERTELFGMAGIDVNIDVTELVLGQIQHGLSPVGFVHLMPVPGPDSKALVNIRIPADSVPEERRVRDLSLPNGTVLSLVITRDGSATVPSGDTVIRAGDELIAVTTAEAEEELRTLLSLGSEEQ
jgi:trk system potassium uptake protein TrkA